MKRCWCWAPRVASVSPPFNLENFWVREVIAAASTQDKRDFTTRFGADETIDYTKADWRETLKTLTGGHGPDVIFDPVGGEVALQAFRSIAWRGRHLVVGFASGTISALAFNLPLLKGGAFWASISPKSSNT